MIRLPGGFLLSDVLSASDSVERAVVENAPYSQRIERTLMMLAKALGYAGFTPEDVTPTSILRSKERNEAVGGSQYSHHLQGYAVDFKFNRDNAARLVAMWDALRTPAAKAAIGYDELAIYNGHLHLSADPRSRGKVLDFRTTAARPGAAAISLLVLIALLVAWPFVFKAR